jgi:hypothetical protein
MKIALQTRLDSGAKIDLWSSNTGQWLIPFMSYAHFKSDGFYWFYGA